MYHSPLLYSKHLVNGSCGCVMEEEKRKKRSYLSVPGFGTQGMPQKTEDEASLE